MGDGDSTPDPVTSATPLPLEAVPIRTRPRRAWQPFTPRGASRFATSTLGRLCLVQTLTALLGAAAVLWFLATAWIPILELAIRRLPPEGFIRSGLLNTPHRSPAPLAAGDFIAFGIDIEERTSPTVEPDLYIKFHRAEFLFCSKLGCAPVNYPSSWTLQFNRPELESTWAAWKVFVLGAISACVMILLFLWWGLQASLYWLPVWISGKARRRQITVGGAWKAAAAALLPGACLLVSVLWLYGVGLLNAGQFLVVGTATQLIPAWVYLFLIPAHLESVASAPPTGPNPFKSDPTPNASPAAPDNPFRTTR